MNARSARQWRLLTWSVLVCLGVLKLFFPLEGDQALFLSYAKGMDEGQRLYVDLWDNKQPGIFWFYLAAGKTFGFTAIGLHLLEWLWLACAALMLRWAASAVFTSVWVVELVPLFTIGLYYWCAWSWFMTQIEILVAMPLAGCLLASAIGSRHPERAPWMHAAFGACAAVVVAFKLVLVVVPIALWLVWVGYSLASRPQRVSSALRGMLLPALLGAAVPLALVALHFVRTGSWSEFVWACFVWPRLALQELAGKPVSDLFVGARWLIGVSLPVWVLTLMVRGDLKRRPLRLIEAQALSWLVAGTLAILVQRFSWWGYHLLLLVPAIGLIAASACDRLAANAMATPAHGSSGRRAEQIAALALVAMFVLYPMQTLRGLRATVRAVAASGGERLEAFRDAIDSRYRERRALVTKLRAQDDDRGANRSSIYVFGNPNWMLEFDRPQAIPIHGWAWEFMLQRQWAALPAQLRAARPKYIYVDAYYAALIESKAPAVASIIKDDYQPVLQTTEPGRWYRRTSRGSGPQAVGS